MHFERSLVVLKNYLGDTVMAAPLFRTVANNSGAIDILGTSLVEQLLRYNDIRARFYDPGNLGNVFQLFRMARRIREGRYDSAFVVNRSFRSALLTRLAGIPIRIGHETEGRGKLLTHRIPYRMDANEAECYLDLARDVVDRLPDSSQPFLEVSEEERQRGIDLLSGATVGVQLGARHEYKQIPAPIWEAILAHFKERGKKIAFFGGKEERALFEAFHPQGADLVGKTSLRETIGALSNLELMIGADTGVMHLAASVGAPTVTSFGPTPAQKWGWYRPPHQVILAPNSDMANLQAEVIIEASERALCA